MDRVAGRSAGAGDRETGGLMIYKKTQPFFFLLFFLLSILDSGIFCLLVCMFTNSVSRQIAQTTRVHPVH